MTAVKERQIALWEWDPLDIRGPWERGRMNWYRESGQRQPTPSEKAEGWGGKENQPVAGKGRPGGMGGR